MQLLFAIDGSDLGLTIPLVQTPGYELEKDLVAALHQRSPAALNLSDRWYQIHPEVTVGQRVADLVLIHASAAPVSRPARVSYFEAAILAYLLARGTATVDAIADELYSSPPSVESRAAKLARLGLVHFAGARLQPTGRHLPEGVRIIAIEAKLIRWREAVEQAAGYRCFANHSYVAMPNATFDRSGGIWSACQNAGVGALSAAPDGTIEVLIDAPDADPQSPEWVRLLSSFVGVAQTSKASRQIS